LTFEQYSEDEESLGYASSTNNNGGEGAEDEVRPPT